MKSLDAIILAGGFAKRLSPLSEYLPKPLLPLGGVPLMNYIIDALVETVKPQRIIISTNAKFAANFKYWMKNDDNIRDTLTSFLSLWSLQEVMMKSLEQ